MSVEPLVFIPVERWHELKTVFKSDWPRCISGFLVLETQEHILKSGLDYGFKVYCPFGDINNGIVALNIKDKYYEVIVQCPKDDTKELEEALRNTNIIEFKKCHQVPYGPKNVMDCVKKIYMEKNCKIDAITYTDTFILDKRSPPYDVRIPSGLSFKLLSLDDIQVVNESWPHKYPGSCWYFELLIKAELGYGLYSGSELLAWVLIKEMGALGHLYTLENHRRKGYGELVLKLISNVLLKQDKYVVAFCKEGNFSASNLYKKLGFKLEYETSWFNNEF